MARSVNVFLLTFLMIVGKLCPLHPAPAPSQNHNYPLDRLVPTRVHFLPSDDLSNRLLVHCVKSAKIKTFASSSEIHKEFLKKIDLGSHLAWWSSVYRISYIFFTELILQICQRKGLKG